MSRCDCVPDVVVREDGLPSSDRCDKGGCLGVIPQPGCSGGPVVLPRLKPSKAASSRLAIAVIHLLHTSRLHQQDAGRPQGSAEQAASALRRAPLLSTRVSPR
jgi:hypothetical protein